MKSFFKVIAILGPFEVSKQDGTTFNKSQIVLQEIGGRYEDSFVATLLGDMALKQFGENDLVAASLRFQHSEYQGKFYQDITVQEIIPIASPDADKPF